MLAACLPQQLPTSAVNFGYQIMAQCVMLAFAVCVYVAGAPADWHLCSGNCAAAASLPSCHRNPAECAGHVLRGCSLQVRLLAGTFADFEVYQRELAAGVKLVRVMDDAEHAVKLRAAVALAQ